MIDINLLSDTVTLPTPSMREAMYRAPVGDDVYGMDPTVNRLQEMAAERMGKEAALFVASGTMGNLVSLLTHCGRGNEVVLGDLSHIFLQEQGGPAALGGIHHHTVPNQPDGTLKLQDIETAIRSDDIHYPRTRLICLENTQMLCGGVTLTSEYIASVCALARDNGIAVHMDGERLFNAAIALGVDVRDLTRDVDSIMFGLSKGLAGPVGSLICGNRDFIEEARRNRKIIGGGMRQPGILAAAGIVALEEMVDRLVDDHHNARLLAEGLMEINGISLDLKYVQTNIVIFTLTTERITQAELLTELDKEGIKIGIEEGCLIRAVTHYGIEKEDIKTALAAFRRLLEKKRS